MIKRVADVVELLQRGDVFFNIGGTEPEEVLGAFVKVLRLPKAIDRKLLANALIEREHLATTAIGNGFAVPHPLQRLAIDQQLAFIAIGYLESPILWNSPDDKPVSTLILIVSSGAEQHLSVLSSLACIADNPKFKQLIAKKPLKSSILEFFDSLKTCEPA